MNDTADRFWERFASGGALSSEEILSFRDEESHINRFRERFRNADPETRSRAIRAFTDIGAQWKEPEEGKRGEFGPFLVDENLAGLAVASLRDADPDVRDAASRVLAMDTPDSIVRSLSPEVESALSHQPGLRGEALLLGKIGSSRAIRRLRSIHTQKTGDPSEIRAALGKSGMIKEEGEIVRQYQMAKEPNEKQELAWLLGYIARPKSIAALAQDLRSSYAYAWNQRAQRSFRIHVIQALSVAYPFEPLLWPPAHMPTDDSYYSQIESWAVEALNAKWSIDRPPFLYEEQAPSARPGGLR